MRVHLCLLLVFSLFQAVQSSTISSITASSPLDQNQTLVSPSQIFELGFFMPNGSRKQYVGIWYKNMPHSKVVWVANRDKPLEDTDQSASLVIGRDGNLKLLDGQQSTVWSTNVTAKSNYSAAVLWDSGNLVLQDRSANEMWQSFDEPTDTLLPNMKIRVNLKTGKTQNLVSWKGEDDPSSGSFVLGITSETPPQGFAWNGSSPYWRSGPWDKSKFIGIPIMNSTYLNNYDLQQNIDQGTSYFYFNNHRNSYFGYFFISSEGSIEFVSWKNGWSTFWEAPATTNHCDIYGTCGPFGVCDSLGSTMCRCLKGFKPRSDEEWKRGNWTGGCLRKTELNCQKSARAAASTTVEKDVFGQMKQMKVPDSAEYLLSVADKEGCQSWCQGNCSCLAFSYVDTIGCMVWSRDLLDLQQFSTAGEDLFIRLASADTGIPTLTILIISLSTVSVIMLFGAGTLVCGPSRWREKFRKMKIQRLLRSGVTDNKSEELIATTLTPKTNLGREGLALFIREIAVKRLSSNSGQGIAEFKNEILLISKLQHRNLVRLFGCCTEGDEKILVYEYLPNKSLDTFLFDSQEKAKLSWAMRFRIIQGVARGLLYLHRDSYLRVIHRDLKVSNILLDEEMNPKISDFGLAWMFEGTQVLVNTSKVAGTL
ncbi:G-type lectin S-receptor-like serine/threonine-protein kinase At1g61370 [Eucalyptus grandis]|uniref:G-type lectin S-receptor-like serine/threonine-protein kinase At1g61370 n=1 Tax=Eucalyptus grandis TaxID=71139 RepID=UPI00192E768B|nr:G-type lectin S-receptor-like serine/threonine-protein kinase At1g61370 [Eucalyptus grandis]